MTLRRLAPVVLALALLAALPSGASAKTLSVSTSPAKPVSTTQKIVLSFKSDRKLTKRQRYIATLWVDAPEPLRRCTADSQVLRSAAGVKKGRIVKITYKAVNRWKSGRWCPGTVKLLLEVVTTDKVGTETVKTVRTKFASAITQAAGDPVAPVVYTPATITLLDGSAITISAPGHADRTSVLTGALQALKPGRLYLNKDYDFTVVGGTISASEPVVDPLCAPDPLPWTGGFNPEPDVSTALLRVDGTASYTYVLPLNAQRLTGCAGTAAGTTTTLAFTGKLDSHKLSRLPLTATVTGITLSDGAAATLTARIYVKVDIADDLV